MNDPEYLAHVADRAEELAGQLHAALTKAIVERIMVRLRRGVNYRLTASDKWMLDILQDAGYLREDLMKELSARTGVILKEMSDAFEDAAVRNLAWDDAIYKAAGLSPAPLRQSPHLMRLVQRGYRKTAGEWRNFTGTLADRCQEKFISECDLAYNLTASHAMSYTQAVRQAVENVARDGVKVQYPSGHEDTIETATLRAVRTGVGQSCGDITLARMEEMGWDIILVSAHLGARLGDGGENFTNHYWLQGKFYSLSGNDERFPPLSVCGIGDVRGLLGANCRHSIGPGDGEFNPFQHFDSEENRKRYELDQRQRLLERRIRATRREVMGLQAGGDLTDEKYRRKAALLQRQEEEYGAFCKKNDLKMLYDRLAVAKYGPEQAKEAKRAAREYRKEREAIAAGMGRRTKNSGAFAQLPERMSKKHIREVADECGISLKGLKLAIDQDEEKLRPGFMVTGRADTQEIGRIDFFPKAFASREELTRTLFHEKIHVEQFKEYGIEYVQNNRSHFERLAYDAENEFIEQLRKEGKL